MINANHPQSSSKKIKVLSLNQYIMGHRTYQDILEKSFEEHFPAIEFYSLHLTDYLKEDFQGKLIYWLLSKKLFGWAKADYDFRRWRTELANSFFARRCLDKALKNYQPDVLHIHTQSIAYLAIPLLQQIPSVISIDYTAALLATEHLAPAHITYKPIIAVEKKCFAAAAHIITWSNRARNSVIDFYKVSPRKVTAISPPAPLEFCTKINSKKSSTPRQTRLLFVGNDFVRKGGEDLLAVFLESFSDSCELDIVTNAYVNLPAIANIRIHQGVRPLSEKMLELYAAADIFVMPTYEDVYGFVFIEAMAAGLPCIGTRVMAVPELVKDGVNGFTITAGDRIALQQAISKLIDHPDLRISMGLKAKELIKQNFDPFSNCQEISRIFHAASIERVKLNKPC
jgi:alpha-maltose-1-phosphate synthase